MDREIVKFKNKLVKNNIIGLALDIDETLSFTIGYLVEKLIERLDNPENLSVKQIIKKYKHTDRIPYWQNEKALKILEELNNSNKTFVELPIIENADKTVNKLNKIIPILAYITVRPESVLESTKLWLKKHGFPNALIIAKPNIVPRSDGNKWKAGVLEFLYPQVIGIVDDNPDLITNLSSNYKGTVYLYNNTECLKNHIKVIPCKNWNEVAKSILNCI
jgi:hypothetical protein